MALTLLAGIAATLFVTGVAVAYQRAPTWIRCPECGGATQPVRAPYLLRKTAPRLQGRWCPQCSWEGLGRVGPEWVSGRRVAHDSGFHWGDQRLPEDFGFQWRPLPEPAPGAEPPHHPSGFRFSTTAGGETAREPAHPSGFAWADGAGETSPAKTAFEWGTPKPPSFVWRDPPRRARKRVPFRWKGAG